MIDFVGIGQRVVDIERNAEVRGVDVVGRPGLAPKIGRSTEADIGVGGRYLERLGLCRLDRSTLDDPRAHVLANNQKLIALDLDQDAGDGLARSERKIRPGRLQIIRGLRGRERYRRVGIVGRFRVIDVRPRYRTYAGVVGERC